ncbi:sodium/sugar symporter [uncultured Succinivibrio sp.]|uniref:sodium/sugar symporter n=1 Tax=uncultured Succinivibrio sp. TaxID=540749 RepID=UPI0025D44821|nr:sodium/sugar symporter [uncultured Succinivibrio sp.]
MENVVAGLSTVDYVIFGVYALVVIAIGLFASKKNTQSAEGYFLAGKSIPWWAVGASLIAANISAEQFIGMSGSGFAIGFGIAAYEFMAAVTLILVGKYFLPIFIEKGIYTIPEFVEKRFNKTLKTILAVFWLCLYIFVNLSSVLYLGGTALQVILGIPMMYAILGLAAFALIYSVYGGLSAVVWTDVIQVAVLVIGGFATSYLSLKWIGGDNGAIAGLSTLINEVPEHFTMILDQSNPQFSNLPGIAVLIGGMWVANLYYWGFNQYIIQRTFAAKSVDEAQKGLVFAAFLKCITPIIVVIPGIAAYYITVHNPAMLESMKQMYGEMVANNVPTMDHTDSAYPWVAQLLPVGVKGLVFAALSAAIVSSLASMLNSTATIFTMDIFKEYINKNASDLTLVTVGRITAVCALVVAIFLAPMLSTLGQAFQYIQEYTGVVSPGILAVFVCGLFYKKTTSNAAITGVLASIVIALLLKFLPINMPFIDQMMYTLVLTIAVIVFVSLSTNPVDDDEKAIKTTAETFKTSGGFAIASYAVLLIVAVIYAAFWNPQLGFGF